MNIFALSTVVVLAAALLAIFGTLYLVAYRSYGRGELAVDGLRLLRLALLGQIALYVLLAVTAFLT